MTHPSRVMGAVNAALIGLLSARAGTRLGRRLAVVEYVGQRTGARRRLVTRYSRAGTTFCIRVGRPEQKTWWRNFSGGRPLRLRLAGQTYDATGAVDRDGDRVCVVGTLGPRSAGAAG